MQESGAGCQTAEMALVAHHCVPAAGHQKMGQGLDSGIDPIRILENQMETTRMGCTGIQVLGLEFNGYGQPSFFRVQALYFGFGLSSVGAYVHVQGRACHNTVYILPVSQYNPL